MPMRFTVTLSFADMAEVAEEDPLEVKGQRDGLDVRSS